MDFKRFAIVPAALFVLCICIGCPDKSYQAPIPDYSNMSDGGSDSEIDTTDQNSE